MLSQLGANLDLDKASTIQLKNVAAVVVTANLPATPNLARISMSPCPRSATRQEPARRNSGDDTPEGCRWFRLRDGNKGTSSSVAPGRHPAGNKAVVNHLSAGRIAGGGTVERSVLAPVGQGPYRTTSSTIPISAPPNAWSRRSTVKWARWPRRSMAGRSGIMAPEGMDARVAFMGG